VSTDGPEGCARVVALLVLITALLGLTYLGLWALGVMIERTL